MSPFLRRSITTLRQLRYRAETRPLREILAKKGAAFRTANRDIFGRAFTGIGHLLRFHLSATEYEHPDLVSSIRFKGSRPVANPVVFGENEPTLLANLRYPMFVGSVLGKMVVVDFYFHSALA